MLRFSRCALKELGTVARWLDEEGHGIIKRNDGTEFVVQQTSIKMGGYKSLAEGQEVEFDIEKDHHGGDHAVCVAAPGGYPPKPWSGRDFTHGSPQTHLGHPPPSS
ncbi:putative Glycine-rich protein 2 [Diplonema papillatum]|nr:putative Glycine-rich protein 2 [Diplonema papillatum]